MRSLFNVLTPGAKIVSDVHHRTMPFFTVFCAVRKLSDTSLLYLFLLGSNP